MATIVEGEASESDEEYDDSHLNSSLTGSILSKESPLHKDIDKLSDTSTTEPRQQEKFTVHHKYKSLFQRKLVDEMFSLRGQVETIANKSYNDANKQMRQLSRNAEHLTSDLKKSARQLQLLTNDLFRLEDKVDELNKQNVLSNIVIKRQSAASEDPTRTDAAAADAAADMAQADS